MSKQKLAKAGKLLCVDSGERSDYAVTGFFLALRDFDPMAELIEYRAAHHLAHDDNFEKDEFLATILAKGLLIEIEYGTLFLGSYYSCEDFTFTPSADA